MTTKHYLYTKYIGWY